MIVVTGYGTSIVQSLKQLRPDEEIVRIDADLSRFDVPLNYPDDAERFVLSAGVLHSKPALVQTGEEIRISLAVNFVNVVRLCESILEWQENAKICVIGSESGFNGSFDEIYAGSKAAVHAYVSTRKVLPTQLLVALAPPIIADSGMTRRRHDYPHVLTERRCVVSMEVARAVERALWSIPVGQHFVERI